MNIENFRETRIKVDPKEQHEFTGGSKVRQFDFGEEKISMIDRYQIPPFDVDPSDEMVKWLHQNKGEWYGDECGIVLVSYCGNEEHGYPGDWVVRDRDGTYSIVKAE